MTNEQKARELAIKCSKTTDDNGNEVYNAFCEAALQEMAEWKERQMIEMAVEWLKNNVNKYLECDGYSECPGFKMYVTDDFYDDFKKAMKEE